MTKNNFIKNITSKDSNQSQKTILEMIKSASIDSFEELCKNSDFIFPFLKDKIVNTFVKLVNKEDMAAIFKFSKIYCFDFEDIIVNTWLKFADEDLTDKILELFENGTQEQKAYCAKYFKYINDPLSLDNLYKYSYSEYTPLKINCAQALSAFHDKKIYDNMKNIVLTSADNFEKISALEFISAYKGKDAVNFVIDNAFDNPFKVQIIANLLDFNGFNHIKNLENDKIILIFSAIIEGYPEDISLDTLGFYEILNFIKLINSYNTQYSKNCLILAKEKFKEFYENDIYSFDLDKNSKSDLAEIYNHLKNLKIDTNNLCEELKEYNTNRYELALRVVSELKLNKYAKQIAENIKNLNENFIAKAAMTLKEIGENNLIPISILNEIKDENIKAFVENCIK